VIREIVKILLILLTLLCLSGCISDYFPPILPVRDWNMRRCLIQKEKKEIDKKEIEVAKKIENKHETP